MLLIRLRGSVLKKSLPLNLKFTSSVIIFIILSLPLPPSRSFNINICGDISGSSDCHCDSLGNSFLIKCEQPTSHSKYTELTIRGVRDLESVVAIDCSEANIHDYKLIPDMKIGFVETVVISKCPLESPTLPFRILEKLGITNTTKFILESNDLGINLTRHRLRGLKNLQHLHLRLKNLTYISNDVFKDFKSLTWLELSAKNFEPPSDLFAPLKNLELLHLVDSSITFLPSGIFKNQGKLKTLNLRGNRLQNLNKDSFKDLTNLIDLNLNSNELKTLETSFFDVLPNLSNLELSFNRLHKLPKDLLANMKNLRLFNLEHNDVPLISLPQGFLSNLPKLKKIRISCGLITLPGNLFANSSNIEDISFTENKLGTLPENLLTDQTKLINLTLINNQLTELPDKLFRNIKELKVLNLSNNLIKHISSDIFSSLTDLKELYFDNNHLTRIDPDAFNSCQSLIILHLQNNFIEFPKSFLFNSRSPFKSLKYLEVLNLQNNFISYILEDWKIYLRKIRLLDLSYNKISSLDIQSILFFPTHRVIVNLEHNEIKSISVTGSKTHTNQSSNFTLILNINNNPLNCDCDLLSFIQFRRGLHVVGEYIMLLIDDNLSCSNPERLHGRAISTVFEMDLLCPVKKQGSKEFLCPDSCKCWERYIDHTLLVDCSNSNKSEIPKLPDFNNKELISTEVNMENNSLIKLSSTIDKGYAQVTKLMLSGNNITELEINTLPSNLTHLDLRHNQLQSLNESVLSFLNKSQKFVSLQLSNNPWTCNCQMKPLLKYMHIKDTKITDLSEMQCAAPFKDTYFHEWLTTANCTKDDNFIIYLSIGLTFFGFSIALVAALYYKYQKTIKIWLYAHKKCLWLVTEREIDKDKLYDAFISYSSLDEDFVLRNLVPKLEQGIPKFRLCIHSRDWPVGDAIPTQISDSVENSRRTIILLSKNFLKSDWAKMEFHIAHRTSLTEKRVRLIVIVYGDIGDITKLDRELKAYIDSNTYLRWGDPLFWEKLRFAMPHRSSKINGIIKNQLKTAIDERLELVNQSSGIPQMETFAMPLIASSNSIQSGE